MRAEPAGEKAVAIGHMHDVPGRVPAARMDRATTLAQVSMSRAV
jgi:hypothetical protein